MPNSTFAPATRTSARDLARATGMTATQVIEEALRAYAPPPTEPPPGRLIERGGLLIMPASGERVTLAHTNASIDAARTERG